MVRVRWEGSFDGPQFEVALYSTRTLRGRHNIMPEVVSSEFLANALSDIGINHRIYYDFTQSIPFTADGGTSCGEAWDEWKVFVNAGNIPFHAADSTFLLHHSNWGGGCGFIGGNIGIAGVGGLDTFPGERHGHPWEFGGKIGYIQNVMHEVGHNMGYTHESHAGESFERDGFWWRTPTMGTPEGGQNRCGFQLTPKFGTREERVFDLRYPDCVADTIKRVAPGVVFITDLDAPNDIVMGQAAPITVELQNRTPTEVHHVEDVFVEDGGIETVGTAEADIPAYSTVSDTVFWTPDEPGTYDISAAGRTITRTVEVDGSVDITGMGIDPAEPREGEPADIVIEVTNSTAQDVTHRFDVTTKRPNRSAEILTRVTHNVRSNATETVEIEWTPDNDGQHTIAANGTSIDVTVLPEATGEVRIADITLSTEDIRVSESVQVTVHAENVGNARAERTVGVAVDGSTIGSLGFALDGGEEDFKTLTWTPSNEGTATITAGGASRSVVVAPEDGQTPPEPPGLSRQQALALAAGGAGFLFLLGKPEDR